MSVLLKVVMIVLLMVFIIDGQIVREGVRGSAELVRGVGTALSEHHVCFNDYLYAKEPAL